MENDVTKFESFTSRLLGYSIYLLYFLGYTVLFEWLMRFASSIPFIICFWTLVIIQIFLTYYLALYGTGLTYLLYGRAQRVGIYIFMLFLNAIGLFSYLWSAFGLWKEAVFFRFDISLDETFFIGFHMSMVCFVVINMLMAARVRSVLNEEERDAVVKTI